MVRAALILLLSVTAALAQFDFRDIAFLSTAETGCVPQDAGLIPTWVPANEGGFVVFTNTSGYTFLNDSNSCYSGSLSNVVITNGFQAGAVATLILTNKSDIGGLDQSDTFGMVNLSLMVLSNNTMLSFIAALGNTSYDVDISYGTLYSFFLAGGMANLRAHDNNLTNVDISGNYVNLYVANNNLGQVYIDTTLQDYADNAGDNGTLDFSGTGNAAPTNAAAITTLEGRGWTVLHN